MSNTPAEFTNTKPFANSEISMKFLDHWVSKLGNGLYFPLDVKPVGPFDIQPTYGMQQVREEINEFASRIVELGLKGTVVEIGLGHFGSTHFLWRTIFEKVITAELSVDRCRTFVENYANFSGGYSCGDDGRSKFVFGPSQSPSVVRKVFEAAGKEVDMVFIDGDHTYAGILCDWLLYHKLVRKGGIVAFHDISTSHKHVSEVPLLIQQLEEGSLDGVKRPINKIIHNQDTGIGYYIV